MSKPTDAEVAEQTREVARLEREFDRAWDATRPPLDAAKKKLAEMLLEEGSS